MDMSINHGLCLAVSNTDHHRREQGTKACKHKCLAAITNGTENLLVLRMILQSGSQSSQKSKNQFQHLNQNQNFIINQNQQL